MSSWQINFDKCFSGDLKGHLSLIAETVISCWFSFTYYFYVAILDLVMFLLYWRQFTIHLQLPQFNASFMVKA